MDDRKLKQIQDEIMSAMNQDEVLENTIVAAAKEVAAGLAINQRARVNFYDTTYVFAYRNHTYPGNIPGVFMTVANAEKFQLLKEKYVPFTVRVEIENNFTLQENLQAATEAFFRHITDKTQAEQLN